jgi:fibro-slime domain-containing protein
MSRVAVSTSVALAVLLSSVVIACSDAGAPNESAFDGDSDGARVDGGGGPKPEDPPLDFGPDDQSDRQPINQPQDASRPVCGNGLREVGEACDDGNTDDNDGCSASCVVEPNFVCTNAGEACVPTVVCGDSRLTGGETCDDGNTTANDGCSATCSIETGWRCPVPGAACFAAACGDGVIAGDEECDDGDTLDNGCSSTCKLQDGFKCPTAGALCVRTVCGDGVREGSEQCDDGNLRPYDGCSPQCTREPSCSGGPCTGVCGDGLIFPGEQCDDGNTRSGDGCSASCTLEPGFACSVVTLDFPDRIDVPVIYRDFKDGSNAGGHPDFQTYSGSEPTRGLVQPTLDADGKPAFRCDGVMTTGGCTASPYGRQLTSEARFREWYRDTDGVNKVVWNQTLPLRKRTDANGVSYVFDSASDSPGGQFFPLNNFDADTWGKEGRSNNFHFTTELKYWFTYKADPNPQAGPTLQFSGDDDVWVFVNGRLALDLGGLHPARSASFVLNQAKATELGLSDGGLYEIALFHAERRTSQSNFRLTLRGFVRARTVCASQCGDGIRTRFEACDEGQNNAPPGSYALCTTECRRGRYCGDGTVDTDAGETCDDGVNRSGYGSCTPDCRGRGPFCGDGVVQANEGEQCDDGVNAGGYGKCSSSCRWDARCGDGIVQANEGEQCDDGNTASGDGCSAQCRSETPR